MRGNNEVRFSDLFKDTVRTHGMAFAYKYYVRTHKMPEWEWNFWMNTYGWLK